jgi:hypothetical protein
MHGHMNGKVADRICTGNQSTFYVQQLPSESRTIYQIKLKQLYYTAGQATDDKQMTI